LGTPADKTASASALVISNPVKKERSIDFIAGLAFRQLSKNTLLQTTSMVWTYSEQTQGQKVCARDEDKVANCKPTSSGAPTALAEPPKRVRSTARASDSQSTFTPHPAADFFLRPLSNRRAPERLCNERGKAAARLQGAERCNTCC
jgi:hypothetical protein